MRKKDQPGRKKLDRLARRLETAGTGGAMPSDGGPFPMDRKPSADHDTYPPPVGWSLEHMEEMRRRRLLCEISDIRRELDRWEEHSPAWTRTSTALGAYICLGRDMGCTVQELAKANAGDYRRPTAPSFTDDEPVLLEPTA